MAIKLAWGSELGSRSLKNKKILITAGPTWVPIDSVRVISNIATGTTGIMLADKLCSLGARVTLLLGPVNYCCPNKKIRLIRFAFFEELKNLIARELKRARYDIIIHSAAVSDFRPATLNRGKISSGKAQALKLLPLPKLAKKIKGLAPKSKLVLFKLESGVKDKSLVGRAKNTLKKYKADLIIANRLDPGYKAFILDKNKICRKVCSKNNLVNSLVRIL